MKTNRQYTPNAEGCERMRDLLLMFKINHRSAKPKAPTTVRSEMGGFDNFPLSVLPDDFYDIPDSDITLEYAKMIRQRIEEGRRQKKGQRNTSTNINSDSQNIVLSDKQVKSIMASIVYGSLIQKYGLPEDDDDDSTKAIKQFEDAACYADVLFMNIKVDY